MLNALKLGVFKNQYMLHFHLHFLQVCQNSNFSLSQGSVATY